MQERVHFQELQNATATDNATPARAPSLAREKSKRAASSRSAAVDPEPPADGLGQKTRETNDELLNASSFGGLPRDFLEALQTAIQRAGNDTSSFNAMAKLAKNPAFGNTILASLSGLVSGYDAEVLKEMVRQWQEAFRQAVEAEKALAKKKKRPIWRCAVCGRYGCQVAPYIEGYAEIQ